LDEDPVGIKSELQGLAADEIAVLQKAARLKR
jgi:hypothetical protein